MPNDWPIIWQFWSNWPKLARFLMFVSQRKLTRSRTATKNKYVINESVVEQLLHKLEQKHRRVGELLGFEQKLLSWMETGKMLLCFPVQVFEEPSLHFCYTRLKTMNFQKILLQWKIVDWGLRGRTKAGSVKELWIWMSWFIINTSTFWRL